uniref:Retrovirus-related Pol polyprotein from transposon TNT 1-94 n=1 Tax=Tanacetum cinerariifolium TaxID=118510 RepID=A0A699H4X2_TANCI|nr:retrovirus-related Pol polyprotein from transposon TNT 1-94 [Tanacetum cinerariifolium]
MSVQVLKVQSDNGTEFKNKKLRSYYEKLGIMHQTSIARTPQQNSVAEQRNRTLVEVARTMLIFPKSPKFIWAEAISITFFTQNFSLVHTRYNKTSYELIKGRKPNVQYFHVLRSLCYLTNDHDDLGKMKPKANNGPGLYCSKFQDSSKDSTKIPSKEDLDNLFGPLYDEYYATRTLKMSDNFAANTLNNEDTPSLSSIIVEDNKAPQVVSSSEEPIANESTTPVSNDNTNESVQEDVTELDGNTFINPFCTSVIEEADSSSSYQGPSNMHEFYQQHRSTNK